MQCLLADAFFRSAATFFCLHGRTFHVTIRAIHTAIALKRSNQSAASFAVVIKLTRISRHQFLNSVAALRAGQSRIRLKFGSASHKYLAGRCFVRANEISDFNCMFADRRQIYFLFLKPAGLVDSKITLTPFPAKHQ